MMRLSIATLMAALLVGPWSGCDRNLDPVAPPAEPPTERAPADAGSPERGRTELLLIDMARGRG